MGFFDLNIPYHEADKHLSAKTSAKTARLKLSIKAIELGYSGVAYNRTATGVMSDHHSCSTPLFPLSSVLSHSPSLSSAATLHRRLLGAPEAAPFRQYTRVTVVVESSAQAAALNSGNPVLKSYDIVAVRPMNQQAFEQACTGSEVDIISIDFSEKLPFRLKQHMVKAAMERGICFEIAYSALLTDVQLRRQMVTSCKLLVNWTRGKNLIISSAAQSVAEMRGPYDVVNLCSLLGLSMEHAKAALSTNCRSLITKALRRKHYYKEAIRVEIIPSGKGFDSNEHWPKDWMKWDPISSGEGDLFLDDMAKSSSDANKVTKVVKSIDFASITDKLPSHGLQVHKLKPVTGATVHSFEIDSSFADTDPTKFAKTFLDPSEDLNPLSLEDMAKSFSAANKVDKRVEPIDFALFTEKLPSHGLQVQDFKPGTEANIQAFETVPFADTEPTKLEKISVDPSEDRITLHTSPSQHQSSCEDSVKLTLSTQTQGYVGNSEITENHTAEGIEEHDDFDLSLSGTIIHSLKSQNSIRRCDAQVGQLDCSALVDSSPMDIDTIGARKGVSGADNSNTPTKDRFPLFSVTTSSHSGVALGSQEDGMKPVSKEMNLEVEENTQLTSYELNDVDNGQLKEMTAVPDAIISASQLVGGSFDEGHKNDRITSNEVSIDTDAELKGDLSQTLFVDEENIQLQEMKDAPVALTVLLSQDEISGSSGHNTAISEPSNEAVMEDQMVTEGHALSSSQALVLDRLSGKKKTKHRMPSQAFVFPFKRILNRTPFKRKSHKAKTQSKLL